jgi:transposase
VVTPLTGEGQEAALFLAVLGASNSPCAEATWSQSLPDWSGAHLRAFAALGGVPQVLVPDNRKAAVPRAHRDEPTLHRTDEALAPHYGIAIVPARAAKPRDQATVAVGIQVVERWILARLRHQTFFSLPEVHTALTALLGALNLRSCKTLPGSRASLCAAIDRPALPPPAGPAVGVCGVETRPRE